MGSIKIVNNHIRTPYLVLVMLELAVLFASVYVGSWLRFDELVWQPNTPELHHFSGRVLVYALVIFTAILAMGQYQTPGPQGRHLLPYISIRVLISLALGGIGLTVLYYVLPETFLGRGLFAYSLLVSFFGLVAVRLAFFRTVDSRSLRKRILVLGAGEVAHQLLGTQAGRRTLTPEHASYSIHGFVEFASEETRVPERYLVRPSEDLHAYCEEYEIDEIVLAISDRRNTLPVDKLLQCKLANVSVSDFVSFWEREKGMLRLDMLNPSWMIFADGCRQGAWAASIQRTFDVVVSLSILLIMAPILILTAIIIFVESGFKGPVFYSQVRVGLNGRPFIIRKFRSMIPNAEKDGAKWADANDMRVTRVGRIIRKLRIDELPQMLNILKGDMSIVGPRPERPEFVEQLDKSVPYYSARHSVKPGLAGWAQLKYPYGANQTDAYNKLQYDLYYVKNHSLLMDLMVLLQTVEVIVLGKGAR